MNLLKNKLLFIILLFLLLTFSLFSSCFALTTNDTITFFNNFESVNHICEIILPSDFGTDGFNYYCLVQDLGLDVFVSNKPFIMGSYGGSSSPFLRSSEGSVTYKLLDLRNSDLSINWFGKYIPDAGYDGYTLNLQASSIFKFKYDEPRISFNQNLSSDDVTTNHTIYNIDTNEEVFQPAPPQGETTQVEPLKEIQQVEEIVPKILEIVKMILPVCLSLFGVLLVVYLIRSKNLLNL